VAFSGVISEVTEIYNGVRVHISLQMHKGKFISTKYTCRYIYANFGTFFFSATQYIDALGWVTGKASYLL